MKSGARVIGRSLADLGNIECFERRELPRLWACAHNDRRPYPHFEDPLSGSLGVDGDCDARELALNHARDFFCASIEDGSGLACLDLNERCRLNNGWNDRY